MKEGAEVMDRKYRVEYKVVQLPMKELEEKYADVEKFLACCKACPNYDTLWSCPPLTINRNEFLRQFKSVTFVGGKITLDKDLIEKVREPEEIKEVSWSILTPEMNAIQEKMIKLEKLVPGSISLNAGGCSLCNGDCTRKEGKPCRQPDRMRYSLDAFSFDITAITKEILGYEIIWCKDSLPEHYTLIHALMSPKSPEEDLIKTVGLI